VGYLEGSVISRSSVKDGLRLAFSHHLFLYSGLLIVGLLIVDLLTVGLLTIDLLIVGLLTVGLLIVGLLIVGQYQSQSDLKNIQTPTRIQPSHISTCKHEACNCQMIFIRMYIPFLP
jgi:hypothetical protein